MKIPSRIRRNVSVVQLKFAARTALLVALAGICLAAVMHHRQPFWIMANGHQEPRDFFTTLPKPAATTGLAGTFTTFEAPDAGTAALTGTGGLAMNASGEITGVYSNKVGVYHGFIRSASGSITEFDAPQAAQTPARGRSQPPSTQPAILSAPPSTQTTCITASCEPRAAGSPSLMLQGRVQLRTKGQRP